MKYYFFLLDEGKIMLIYKILVCIIEYLQKLIEFITHKCVF
jgi:hypothetical protein